MKRLLYEVLGEFGIDTGNITIEDLHNGLINNTYKVITESKNYILQKINTVVFKQPEQILENIASIGEYLLKYYPAYIYTNPIATTDNRFLVYKHAECYRLMPYINDSVTCNVLTSENLAEAAAEQFSLFTKNLEYFDIEKLNTTIPDFHNLTLRYKQYSEALLNGNPQRIDNCKSIIETIDSYNWIVEEYQKIVVNPEFKKRVTHHDTKISNVLFDKYGNGICVIDLDTVMPGYFISDLGDMMRTYLSAVSEEEQDLSLVAVRPTYFKAVVKGYLKYMSSVLTDTEKQYIVYSGAFMIYMQALRFFTDYLNDDKYYGAKYPEHNLIRATNQLALLKSYDGMKDELTEMVLSEIR